MLTDDVKEWLTAEELTQYERYVGWAKKESKLHPKDYDVRHKLGIHGIPPILESLAASRALLAEAKQYVQDEFRSMAFDEEQEREWQRKGQDLITAIAAELAGIGGGKQ